MSRYLLAMMVCLTMVCQAGAWHQEGHEAISRAAAEALPDVVPVFLRQGGEALAHYSVDPDLVRVKPMKELSDATSLNHYFDLERIKTDKLPAARWEFLAMLAADHIQPRDVGLGLYALIEARQKLAIALAEYRKWPQNKYIQAKCLVYAGEMAHYAEDLCQPLHTTVDHDGRLTPQGRSPRSGIHEKMDDLLRHLSGDQLNPPADMKVVVIAPGVQPIYELILATHKLVDRVYELEALLPATDSNEPLAPRVQALAKERFEAGVLFTASLLYSAWEDSAAVQLPKWLKREAQ